ncbi:MAG: 2-phospho-L-lactate transferase [Gammaproteobacteria bacterium]
MSKYLAITGGVGGAKLALGLSRILGPSDLGFLVNTGDDFEHLGLHVSPDIDTLMYTLSGLSNPQTGWGRVGESWNFIESLGELGGETWFKLGDRDLAVHVRRTVLLAGGERLTDVTATLFRAFGVEYRTWPMSDDPVRTLIDTDAGQLSFQHYFVRERCEPAVRGFEYRGADTASAIPEFIAWMSDPDLAGVIICPSNPFLSIDPILALDGIREALMACTAPVIAVSPIVGGEAIKGPTAKIMEELDVPRDARAVAMHYRDLLDGFILDETDRRLVEPIGALGLQVAPAQSLMRTLDDKINLAHTALKLLEAC